MYNKKLLKLEKIITMLCILPVLAIFVVGIFIRGNQAFVDIFTIIGLAVVGVLLITGTQIIPLIRLWKYIIRVKAMLFYALITTFIYVGSYGLFYYTYAILKSENQLPLFILLLVIASNRFYPTDRAMEKYIESRPDLFPEEQERLNREQEEAIEKERQAQKRIEEHDAEVAKKIAETPDFDDFFGLNGSNVVESSVENVEKSVNEESFTDDTTED